MTTVRHDDLFHCLARLGAERFQLLHHIHALDDRAEDDVSVVQPRRLHGRDEELRAVRVGPRIRHRHYAWSRVLQGEVLVGELHPVDRLAASAVVVGEVTALAHEVGDDAVESGALVPKALLACAQRAEVLACLRRNVASQLEQKRVFTNTCREVYQYSLKSTYFLENKFRNRNALGKTALTRSLSTFPA